MHVWDPHSKSMARAARARRPRAGAAKRISSRRPRVSGCVIAHMSVNLCFCRKQPAAEVTCAPNYYWALNGVLERKSHASHQTSTRTFLY